MVDFSHPEMFIVLCMEHSKIRCTRHARLWSLTYGGAKTVIQRLKLEKNFNFIKGNIVA